MDNCAWCDLSNEDKRYQLYETEFWSVFLSDEQDYIGRCILVLKRHCGSMSDNFRAIHVYKECGFREYGRTEKDIYMEYVPI